MKIEMILNGTTVTADIEADMSLFDFVRKEGCYSVKCGCETTNCGLCTVLVEGDPQLSCAYPAMRANGKKVTTLEGLQEEIKVFAGFMADQGADQCGYCNPGFLMNVRAMERELTDPTMEDIKKYLAGNLCRCSGYESQHRAIEAYLSYKKSAGQITVNDETDTAKTDITKTDTAETDITKTDTAETDTIKTGNISIELEKTGKEGAR